jgi:ACS family hexuronate transporter-like MFS transporter
VIAPPLIVLLSLKYGWRSAFLLVSVAGLLWVPFWLRATRNHDEVALHEHSEEVWGLKQRLSNLGNKRVLAYVLTRFLEIAPAISFSSGCRNI